MGTHARGAGTNRDMVDVPGDGPGSVYWAGILVHAVSFGALGECDGAVRGGDEAGVGSVAEAVDQGGFKWVASAGTHYGGGYCVFAMVSFDWAWEVGVMLTSGRYLHAHRIKLNLKDEFPAVWDWICRMKERPGVKAGMEGAVFPEGSTVLKT
jgi:hypothetical protein